MPAAIAPMKSITHISICFFLMSFFIEGYANGDHALNQSYSNTKRGLNYVQGSGKAALRAFPPLGNWPVEVTISGIPNSATIEKAFVYFTAGYVTLQANRRCTLVNSLSTSQNFPATRIGLDVGKCWWDIGTAAYRADVTSHITGNGTYELSSNTGDSLTDGFTLLIIYSVPTASYTGSIFIHDGVIADSLTMSTKVDVIVSDTTDTAQCFIIASDIQQDQANSRPAALLRLSDPDKTVDNAVDRKFWSFDAFNFGLRKNQTFVNYVLYPGNDCAAITVAGVYLQLPDTTVTISEPFSDTLYCAGDTFGLKYDIIRKFRPNNVFKVFLSDGQGSFANPLLIGSKNSDTAGFVTCVLPVNLPADSNYILRITASSPVDTINNNDKRIRISHYPLPPIVASSSPTCEGTTLFLHDYSIDNAMQYTWTGPNNFKRTLRNPELLNTTLAADGKYFLFKENFSCGYRDSLTVLVKPRPAKPLTTIFATVCEGDTVKIKSQSTTPNITYNVLTPDKYLTALLTVDTMFSNVTINDSGWYKVAAVLDGCLSLIDSINGVVYRMPVLDAQTNSPVCQGATIELYANDTTPGASYIWKGPGGFSAPLKEPLIGNADFINDGKYTVVANVHQCADTDTVSVIIKPKPPKPVLNSNSPLCELGTLNLFATGIANVTYSWNGPDGFTSVQQNPVIDSASLIATGKYIATVGLDECTTSDTIDVLIKPLPGDPKPTCNSPLNIGNRLQLEVSNPTTGASYKWAGPNNFVSIIANPFIDSITEAAVGVYNVAVNLDGCFNDGSTTVELNVPPDGPYMKFYPNPNNGNFTLEGLFLYDQLVPVSVINVLGQSLFKKVFKTESKKLNASVSIPFVADGFYYIRFTINDTDKSIPFIIAR